MCFGKKLTKGMKKQSDETKKVRIAGLFEIKKLSILTVGRYHRRKLSRLVGNDYPKLDLFLK